MDSQEWLQSPGRGVKLRSLALHAISVALLDTSLPNVRLLQQYIREQVLLEVKLSSGDVWQARLAWQDPDCLCLKTQQGETIILWRSALVFLRPLS
nr:hypothetical protein EKO22_09495 [Synechococcus elongatus PCC 11802]